MPVPKVCTQVLLALLWGIKLATPLEKVSALCVGRERLRSPGTETGSGGLCIILRPWRYHQGARENWGHPCPQTPPSFCREGNCLSSKTMGKFVSTMAYMPPPLTHSPPGPHIVQMPPLEVWNQTFSAPHRSEGPDGITWIHIPFSLSDLRDCRAR